jgi:hypothetical protein
MNDKPHSCEAYDGECMGWKGFHGNDHDWTAEDYAAQRAEYEREYPVLPF